MSAFYRQKVIKDMVGVVIIPEQSSPPNSFSFHYINFEDIDKAINEDEIKTDLYQFKLKDGVLGLFDTLYLAKSEFIRAFSSNSFIDIIAGFRVGEKLPINFVKEFDEVLGIDKFSFPIKGYSEEYYGKLRYYVDQSFVNNHGFHVISSYEEPFNDSNRTNKRLIMGFRVYGISENEYLTWRSTLSISMQYFQEENWHLSLLHTAISVESFIDNLFAMTLGEVSERLKDYFICVTEKSEKLHAINDKKESNKYSKTQVNKKYNKINEEIFKLRNNIAHGRSRYTEITKEQAITAIKTAVEFIWDLDIDSRKELITLYPINSVESLINDEFVNICNS